MITFELMTDPLYVFAIPLWHRWKVENYKGFTINLWRLKVKFWNKQ